MPFLCQVFLIFVQKLHLTFLHLKRDHEYQGNIYEGPSVIGYELKIYNIL